MATDLQLATADTTDSRFVSLTSYGIFLNGAQVMVGDSFLGYEYVNDSRVSMYPVQSGGFGSYNKVDTPYDLRVRITKGGSAGDRATLLNEVLAARKSLNVYDIVTPEQTYTSANLSKVAHHHTMDSGATLLVLELQFVEVRVIASAVFTAASPTTGGVPLSPLTQAIAPRNDPVQVGAVQPQTLSEVNTQIVAAQLAADHAAMSHR